MICTPLSTRPRRALARRAGRCLATALAAACVALGATGPVLAQASRVPATPGDHIVAIVNQELVTSIELGQRMQAMRAQAARAGQPVPSEDAMREQALESLIQERAIVTHAREMGWRIEEAEIDRAVRSVAAQNRMNVEQLTKALQAQGLDMTRFRDNLRDQIMVERTREREVNARIEISEDEITREIEAEQAQARSEAEVNLAQILVPVPEGADEATVRSLRARIDQALARVRAGEPFETVAREVSEDANRERGGEIGLRPVDRLPDLFAQAARTMTPGQVTEPLRSGAGFHVLKLLERKQAAVDNGVETRARHILLRLSDQTPPQQAAERLLSLRRQIESGERTFEDVAREVSEDGSAAQGGDLGWFAPGVMVPEFEQPASRLPVGAISDPIRSRFGMHLIQVLDRRPLVLTDEQRREQVRNVLRERKFDKAFQDWVEELRARAYVELRDAPAAS